MLVTMTMWRPLGSKLNTLCVHNTDFKYISHPSSFGHFQHFLFNACFDLMSEIVDFSPWHNFPRKNFCTVLFTSIVFLYFVLDELNK